MLPFGLVPLHMGSLHTYEQVLVYVLAFGPFLLLAAAIWIRRRQDAAQDAADESASQDEATGASGRDHSANH